MALKPHRSRYWLTSPDPEFTARMRDIVDLYLNPPPNAIRLCFDERTAMQAIERLYPTLPMRPGQIERREFEYLRHGTLDLLAALDVDTGEVYAATYERHTQVEVADFFDWLLRQFPPSKPIHIVMDNLPVHKTDRVQKALRRGGRKVTVHWTPVRASWLNQIEIFFSILDRRVLKRGSFTSKDDLTQKLIRFVEWYDDHDAKPFRWTYTGHPLLQ